jgi:hypothetical protein
MVGRNLCCPNHIVNWQTECASRIVASAAGDYSERQLCIGNQVHSEVNHAVATGNYKRFDLLVGDRHSSFSFGLFNAARREVNDVDTKTIKSFGDHRVLGATIAPTCGWVDD